MNLLTLIVGPPGSGKSTLTRSLIYNDCDHGLTSKYINQDEQGKEKHLKLFNEYILNKNNIIIDRMNFNKEQRNRYISIAKENNYNIKIIVLHESYETCLKRILIRKNHPTITNEKEARSALQTFFTKYERPTKDECNELLFKYPEGIKDNCLIIDLDGTLCNIDHRLHFINQNKKNWKSFFQNLISDKVNNWCSDIINKFSNTNQIIFCSGRPDNYKKETIEWLNNNNLWFNYLYMRNRNDFRPDNIIKEIILDFEILTRFNPYFIIDDREMVCQMWRSRGFTVLQCNEGKF